MEETLIIFPLYSCNCFCKSLLAVIEYLLFKKYFMQIIRALLRTQVGA